ncbi:hypothetical protein SALBM311S_01192 [Streptomyces alboniger]
MPKSSRDIFTPCAVSPARVSAARCGSSRRTCSVISSWKAIPGTVTGQPGGHGSREPWGVDIARGDIDRHRDEQPLGAPPRDLGEGRVEELRR